MAVTERSALSAMTLGLSEVYLFTNSLIISCLDTMYLDHMNPILPCEVLPKPSPHPHLDFSSSFHSPLSPISAVHVCTGVRPPMGAQATSPPNKGSLPMPGALNFQSSSAGDGASGVFSPSMLEWLHLVQWKEVH